jgi:hypothetical protein
MSRTRALPKPTKASPKPEASKAHLVENARKQALRAAQKLRDEGATWTRAQNLLFGPQGEISRLFPTEPERAAFLKSPESAKVAEIVSSLSRERPQPSGRILVRLPKSVHAALLAEAEREGTSLNQLIVAKLCVDLTAARS